MCACVFPFALQFERVRRQTPANEQNEQRHREFLKRSGVVGRTPPAEGWGDANSLPSISPDPSETVSATRSDLQNKVTAAAMNLKGAPVIFTSSLCQDEVLGQWSSSHRRAHARGVGVRAHFHAKSLASINLDVTTRHDQVSRQLPARVRTFSISVDSRCSVASMSV